jgi:hypothetical protein
MPFFAAMPPRVVGAEPLGKRDHWPPPAANVDGITQLSSGLALSVVLEVLQMALGALFSEFYEQEVSAL